MTADELLESGVEPKILELAVAVYEDLLIKSMMFDMDIDIETMTLVEKRKYQEPGWLRRWKDKQKLSDRTPEDYQGWD